MRAAGSTKPRSISRDPQQVLGPTPQFHSDRNSLFATSGLLGSRYLSHVAVAERGSNAFQPACAAMAFTKGNILRFRRDEGDVCLGRVLVEVSPLMALSELLMALLTRLKCYPDDEKTSEASEQPST